MIEILLAKLKQNVAGILIYYRLIEKEKPDINDEQMMK